MVGASSLQYVSVATPFVLAPGMYYWGWSCNNTTSRGFANAATAVQGRRMGLLEQTSAYPLPATMTPVAWTRAWGALTCGIARV